MTLRRGTMAKCGGRAVRSRDERSVEMETGCLRQHLKMIRNV